MIGSVGGGTSTAFATQTKRYLWIGLNVWLQILHGWKLMDLTYGCIFPQNSALLVVDPLHAPYIAAQVEVVQISQHFPLLMFAPLRHIQATRLGVYLQMNTLKCKIHYSNLPGIAPVFCAYPWKFTALCSPKLWGDLGNEKNVLVS